MYTILRCITHSSRAGQWEDRPMKNISIGHECKTLIGRTNCYTWSVQTRVITPYIWLCRLSYDHWGFNSNRGIRESWCFCSQSIAYWLNQWPPFHFFLFDLSIHCRRWYEYVTYIWASVYIRQGKRKDVATIVTHWLGAHSISPNIIKHYLCQS